MRATYPEWREFCPQEVIDSEGQVYGPQWERALKRALLYQLSYAPNVF
jgi:hypothetical protein